MARATNLLILAGAALTALASCSSTFRVSSFPVTVAEPLASASEVAFVRDLPPSSYAEVARIDVRWPGLRNEGDVRRDEQIAQAIRAEAARLGADAVIHLTMVSESGGWRPDRWYPEAPRFKGVSALAVRRIPSSTSGMIE